MYHFDLEEGEEKRHFYLNARVEEGNKVRDSKWYIIALYFKQQYKESFTRGDNKGGD